jgi:splicing factor 3A subunit 1
MLDPRWKEQKAKAESRYASTNISTVDVANNLKRLASQRSDVFDVVTGQPISEEEAARRKKATMMTVERDEPNHELGPQDTLPKLSVEEQIKAIRDKFGSKS